MGSRVLSVLSSPAVDMAPSVEQALSPFPACCLGLFCLGYNLNDTLGRVQGIRSLLERSGLVPPDLRFTDADVRRVLHGLLQHNPNWIVPPSTCGDIANCVVQNPRSALVNAVLDWAPYTGPSTCCSKVLLEVIWIWQACEVQRLCVAAKSDHWV